MAHSRVPFPAPEVEWAGRPLLAPSCSSQVSLGPTARGSAQRRTASWDKAVPNTALSSAGLALR